MEGGWEGGGCNPSVPPSYNAPDTVLGFQLARDRIMGVMQCNNAGISSFIQ